MTLTETTKNDIARAEKAERELAERTAQLLIARDERDELAHAVKQVREWLVLGRIMYSDDFFVSELGRLLESLKSSAGPEKKDGDPAHPR